LDDKTRLVRGLEIGVNDYVVPPIDKNELLARVRTQVRKRRYLERLRDDVGVAQSPLYGKAYWRARGAGGLTRQATRGVDGRH
jgi:DNA-binding response OmpR family regulator